MARDLRTDLRAGLILVAARAWVNARLDVWLTGSYVTLVAAYAGSGTLAVSGWWNGVLQAAFGL